MLCLADDDPWKKVLRRYTLDPDSTVNTIGRDYQPAPLALLLDDGTRCRDNSRGRTFPRRDDGYYAAYDCGAAGAVLAMPSDTDQVDRSQQPWTVKIGQVGDACGPQEGTPCAHFPPPENHTVRTAWYAGN